MGELDVNPNATTLCESAEDAVNATGLHLSQAMGLYDVLQFRADNRGEYDVVVEISQWLADQRGSSTFIVCETLKDISEKAYVAEGAYDVNLDALDEQQATLDESDVSVTSALTQIDETDDGYADEVGVTFIPRSQIEAIITLE